MKKKLLTLAMVLAGSSLTCNAQTGFYEFDNVLPKTILNLFLQAKREGRTYPTNEQFVAAGISLADLEFVRSHVKRRPHLSNEDRLNQNVYENRQLFMCIPMGNGRGGFHGYPNNAMGKSDVYSMWNYTTTFGSWNHGFFQAPGSWVDAAHKNGCRIMSGQMFFESHFGGADDTDWIRFISTQENGEYAYVEPMINALMFFGSDGIVYNWEASGYTNPHVVAFHKALYKKARERSFMDYNSLIYTLGSSLYDGNSHYLYGTKDEPIHELFLNYEGGNITSSAGSSQSYADNQLGGSERLYAGVHIASMSRTWDYLAAENAKRIGLAVWGEHESSQIYSHTQGATDKAWQTDYQLLLERFFSGGNHNPANRPDLSISSGASYANKLSPFSGMAEFFPERSTIQGTTAFLTHFNLGNGEYYYHNGLKRTAGGWYNMSAQDMVPTYRWLVYNAGESVVNTALSPTFTHQDAYVGGTSLSLKGNVPSGADVILYKTALTLSAGAKAKVAVKKVTGDAELSLLLKLGADWKVYSLTADATSWREQEINLSDIAGRRIDRIALRVRGNADLLVGKIELNDDFTVAPAPIKTIVSAETVAETQDDITVKLHWTVDANVDTYGRSFNDDNHIDHFEIVYENSNQEVIEVGRTSQWATLASRVPFPADDEVLKLGVRSVSVDLKTKSEIKWVTVNKGQADEVVDPANTEGQSEIYAVNFNKKTPHTREDRYMMHIGLRGSDNILQKYPNNDSQSRITKQLYLDATEKAIFDVVAGETYTPYIDYSALWMSGYAYVDWDNSGDFDTRTGLTFSSNGRPTRTDACEVVSFSSYNNLSDSPSYSWYRSDGVSFSTREFPKPNNIKMGAFKVPENTEPGIYRMRFKLDWNSLDPAGNNTPGNLIYVNGGDIIDVLLNVHATNVEVGAKAENGTVSHNGTVLTEELNSTAPFKEDLQVVFAPIAGYRLIGATVRHGYNLNNEASYDGDGRVSDVGNRQWWEEKIDFTEENYTIPKRLINGNVLIMPIYESVTGIENVVVTKEMIRTNDIYNLSGQLVRKAGSKAVLPAGIYIVKGYKFVVR